MSWGENGDGQLGLGYFGAPICLAMAFVQTLPEPIPGDQGNVLLGVKESTDDVHLHWDALPPPWPGPWRVYWWQFWVDRSEIGDLSKAEGNSGLRPLRVPAYVHRLVVTVPPAQVYYRLMGTSRCYGYPGP